MNHVNSDPANMAALPPGTPGQPDWETRIATIVALDQLAALLACLERQGIQVIVLKGAALAATLYGDPGLRRMGDIDLLVRPPAVPAAAAVLEAQGFAALTEMQPGFSVVFRNEQTFVRRRPPGLQIDLHWGLSARSYWRCRLPMDWFWAHTQPWRIGGQPALMFDPTAMLLHLCLHAYQHGNHSRRWSRDIALLLARWRVDWEEALTVAARSGLGLPIQWTLETVRRDWGVRPPPAVCEQIAQLPVEWQQRLLRRFCAARDTSGLNLADALMDPNPLRTLALGWRTVFPRPAYMRQRYGANSRRAIAASYGKRVCTGGKRIVQSLVQALAV